MKEFKLISGATLKVGLATFADARNLYQSILAEAKSLSITMGDDIDANMIKNLVCTFFSSKDIESKINKCLEKCLYNNARITDETFESEEARQDYLEVITHCTMENVAPFVKGLSAKWSGLLDEIMGGLK